MTITVTPESAALFLVGVIVYLLRDRIAPRKGKKR